MSVVDKVESGRTAEYRRSIIDAFTDNNGNITLTARKLGVSREWVRRWCKKLGINPDKYRKAKKQWSVSLGATPLGSVYAYTEREALVEAIVSFDVAKSNVPKLAIEASKPRSKKKGSKKSVSKRKKSVSKRK